MDRPYKARICKNEDALDYLVHSQEHQAWPHMHLKNIVKELDISHSFICRIMKTKDIKQFKRLKTPSMNDTIGKRRAEYASLFLEKFEKYPRIIKHEVFQDKSDFLL